MGREPWLLVQEGGRLYLLAREQRDFVFITVNKALTAEKEEQLARSGSFSKPRLQEMGLTFRVLPGGQIRGAALTGSEAGDTLYFYPASGKKQKYVFSDDYEKERIDAFFGGVERFTAPGNKKKKNSPDNWRVQRQDPALYQKMGWVPPILMGMGIASSAGYLMNRTWPWYLAYLMSFAAPVVLDILFPAYFTLITEKGGPKHAHDLSIPMWVQVLVLVLMTRSNWLDESLFLKLWAVCGILSVLMAYLLVEEFRRMKGALLAVLFGAGIAATLLIGHTNCVFDFAQPETYVLAVEELEESRSGKTTSYECTVTLPDGRTLEIDISGRFYHALEVGDEVQVALHPGALGIGYVTVQPME